MSPTNLRVAAIAIVTLLVLGACGSETEPASAPSRGRPMILDYSPTLSDVPALMFLASHPEIDLLAVTLPGTGESDCGPGVRHTRALLAVAGRPDTPVGCGSDTPMAGDRDWPDAWRTASNDLSGVLLPGVADADPVDAEELLARTLRQAADPVTIVTLAPLTNLGTVLSDDLSLVDHIETVVVMGGAFAVAGNVAAAPDAEWNLHIDPESVRAVLDSGVPVTFVGLDATNNVQGSARIHLRLTDTATTAAGESVRQLWNANLGAITSEGWYLWDELAAVVAVEPSVATIEDHTVAIADDGATSTGQGGVAARVATSADPIEFERVFLEVFAGGALPVSDPLTSAEQDYLDRVVETMAGLDAVVGEMFVTIEELTGSVPTDEVMGEFAATLFGALTDLRDDLAATGPPASFASQHDTIVAAAADLSSAEPSFLAAVAATAPTDPITGELFWETFSLATDESGMSGLIDDFDNACRQLENAAYSRGAQAEMCTLG